MAVFHFHFPLSVDFFYEFITTDIMMDIGNSVLSFPFGLFLSRDVVKSVRGISSGYLKTISSNYTIIAEVNTGIWISSNRNRFKPQN